MLVPGLLIFLCPARFALRSIPSSGALQGARSSFSICQRAAVTRCTLDAVKLFYSPSAVLRAFECFKQSSP